MSKKRFDAEFKKEVAKACIEGRRSASKMASELGVHNNTIYKWIQAYEDDPVYAFPGTGNMKPPDEELSKARQRIIELEEEVEILKKAAAYFIKNSK